jgi:hypothetical protein
VRKLYLVPIIHMSADIGSLAPTLDETAKAEFGPQAWQKHKEAVASFWDCIAQFLDALDVKGFKIYQDGMLANGADGLRIIREGINQGSRNYEIVGKLLERGAVLEKTEDLALLKQEYTYIAKIARSKSPKEKEAWALRYKSVQPRLLRQRDDFIAGRIKETLDEGETSILFIGAYHDILSKLPSDIQVTQVGKMSPELEIIMSLLHEKGIVFAGFGE